MKVVFLIFLWPVFTWASFHYEPAVVSLKGRVSETTAPELLIEDEEERDFCFREAQIPALALTALSQAYLRARASGYSVVVVKNNVLVEIHPDGTETFIKSLPPDIQVTEGQRIEIDSTPSVTILSLDEPIDVGIKGDLNQIAETGICEIQLVFSQSCLVPSFLDDITIRGSLLHNYASQYRRRVVMIVHSWEKVR